LAYRPPLYAAIQQSIFVIIIPAKQPAVSSTVDDSIGFRSAYNSTFFATFISAIISGKQTAFEQTINHSICLRLAYGEALYTTI